VKIESFVNNLDLILRSQQHTVEAGNQLSKELILLREAIGKISSDGGQPQKSGGIFGRFGRK